MKKNLLLVLACSFILGACCNDGPGEGGDGEGGENKDKVVSFSPTLKAPTRATDTSFDTNDLIGVFAVEYSASDPDADIKDYNYADNVKYSYNGSRFTAVNTNDGIKIPSDGKLYYTAVYPYVSNAKKVFTFGVNTDQRTYDAYTQSDLCTASTDAHSEEIVDLPFSHRLSKIVINLEGESWTGSDIQVKLKNVYTFASVNLNNFTFIGTDSKDDIICASNGTRSFKAIIPPQTIPQGEKFFVVTKNGVDYTYDTPGLDFRSGKAYEYTVIIGKNDKIVEFTGDINPWNVDERINDVVPGDIQEKLEPYITIYRGNTPPNIESTVFVDPFQTVYCEDYGNGGYAPGDLVNSIYIRFSNQNTIYNTLDIETTNANGTSTSNGTGAFISGSGNNFSAFFNTIGQTDGISTKTALVISGTKTSAGISNLKYAFIMVEKGSDPNNKLMKEGVFRVFEDKDGVSAYTSWPQYSSAAHRSMNNSQHTDNSIFDNVK